MRNRQLDSDTTSHSQLNHITTRELAQAKEAVSTLLDQLGVAEYLFEVEPRNGLWEVRIDCAAEDAWQSLTLAVDVTDLLQVEQNSTVRQELATEWSAKLCSCSRHAP